MTTRPDLDALEAAEAKATPGDWHTHEDSDRTIVSDVAPNLSLLGLDIDGTAIVFEQADAALICMARNALPWLIAQARRTLAAEADRDRLLKRLSVLRDYQEGARQRFCMACTDKDSCHACPITDDGEWT